MADRQTAALKLVARCRAVGWKVNQMGGRNGCTYKVTMSPCRKEMCNHIMQIHLTPGDVNAEKAVERELNAHGLAGLEKKLIDSRNNERKMKLEADRRANDKALAEVQRNETLIAKASGPYQQPEYVDDSWFIGDHPAPWHRWVIMTPRQAKWILNTMNSANRPIYDPAWERYKGIILSKQWRWTHQSGAVDRNKILQDGQHRLIACSESGEEVVMGFCVGMDPDNWKAIDEGHVRTAAQGFARGGAETNVRALAACVRIVKIFDKADRNGWREKFTNQQIIDEGQHDIENYRRSALFGARNGSRLRMNIASLSGLHYLLRRENGIDNPYVEAFFRGLVTERKLDPTRALLENDPRKRLREYLINAKANRKRLHAFDALCLGVIAWNHCIQDVARQNLRWAAGQSVPRIITIAPDAFPPPSLFDGEIEETLMSGLRVVA